MAHEFRKRRLPSLLYGATLGFVAGIALTFESWLFASIIKVLLTWDTGIWPDWFPGHIPEFILSRWWIIIIVATCTVAGTIVGLNWPRRLELY